MFAFVALDLVCQYLAKRLAGRNDSKITYFVYGMQNVNSINVPDVILQLLKCTVVCL